MAVRYAVASGNWSTGSTWNTGTVPTAADDVYADGKFVTIDQSITVTSLNNGLRSGGTAGGYFQVNNSGYTVTATSLIVGTSANLFYSNTTGTLTINANLPTWIYNAIAITINGAGSNITYNGTLTAGGTTGYAHGILVNSTNVLLTVNGNLTNPTTVNVYSAAVQVNNNSRAIINGNVTGPACTGSIGTFHNNSTNSIGSIINGNCVSGLSSAVSNVAGCVTTINGTQTASGSTGVYAISNATNSVTIINGDCLGSLSGTPSSALLLTNSGAGTVIINGSVIQRSVGPSSTIGIVTNSSTGTINISGNVGGGTVASSIGVSNSSTGTINVTGSVSGGTNATMTPAIYSTTAGIITVTGNTISNLYPAIYSTNALATHRLYGNLVSANGIFPIYGLTTPLSIRISPSVAQTITLQDTSNVNRAFDTSTTTTGLPAASNVRRGTSYGNINQYSGTMYVPTPDNVRKDVLTDNTVGTADLSVSSLIDTLTGSTNPMAVRLRNVSTAQITGSQISGLLNNP
jgi:hypothetical protein